MRVVDEYDPGAAIVTSGAPDGGSEHSGYRISEAQVHRQQVGDRSRGTVEAALLAVACPARVPCLTASARNSSASRDLPTPPSPPTTMP
jgi:hypothetical protein